MTSKGVPASACFNIASIWLSLYRDFFMQNLLLRYYEKILLLKSAIFRGDYPSLQADLDEWLVYYNTERTHQGKMCCGRTPLATLEDGKQIWQDKFIN